MVHYLYLTLYLVFVSAQHKINKFSIEDLSDSYARFQNNKDKTARPNIDHLIKKIFVERRRERKKSITLGAITLSIILFFIYIAN